MASIYDLIRAANMMTAEERQELLDGGWDPRVILSLEERGFRPCKPDYVAARFEGVDIKRTMGFLRQTSMPHLHITVANDPLPHVVLERIDTAIYEAGRMKGHDTLASDFQRFFQRCQSQHPGPDLAILETRLAKLESENIRLSEMVGKNTLP
jgi:hypothetical protein